MSMNTEKWGDDSNPWLSPRMGPPVPNWYDQRANIRYATVDGVEWTFHTIGALAQALGKKPVTIKMYLMKGYIPEPSWRQPGFIEAFGSAGVRLWTREQIDSIVRIAKEEGIINDTRIKAMKDTNFAARVHALWMIKNW